MGTKDIMSGLPQTSRAHERGSGFGGGSLRYVIGVDVEPLHGFCCIGRVVGLAEQLSRHLCSAAHSTSGRASLLLDQGENGCSPIKVGAAQGIARRKRVLQTENRLQLKLFGWIVSQNDFQLKRRLFRGVSGLTQHRVSNSRMPLAGKIGSRRMMLHLVTPSTRASQTTRNCPLLE